MAQSAKYPPCRHENLNSDIWNPGKNWAWCALCNSDGSGRELQRQVDLHSLQASQSRQSVIFRLGRDLVSKYKEHRVQGRHLASMCMHTYTCAYTYTQREKYTPTQTIYTQKIHPDQNIETIRKIVLILPSLIFLGQLNLCQHEELK